MIECRQARNLFDAHLSDGLSSSLTAELHAHLVACGDCQHEMSLFEACGGVIAKDRIGPRPGDDFAERVLSVWRPLREQAVRAKRWRTFSIWTGTGVSAAAAAIMLFVLPLNPAVDEDGLILGAKVVVDDVAAGDQETESPTKRLVVHPVRAVDAARPNAQSAGEPGAQERDVPDIGENPLDIIDDASPAAPLFHLTRILEE